LVELYIYIYIQLLLKSIFFWCSNANCNCCWQETAIPTWIGWNSQTRGEK